MRSTVASRTLALTLVAACLGWQAAPADARVAVREIGRFSEPVYVTSPPGDPSTLAVVERYGRVRIVRRGRVERGPLLDLRGQVRIDDPNETVDQRGLLSIAFAPDYARSGRIFVDLVDRAGRLRVAQARRGDERLRTVLDLGEATTQHHGGQLQMVGEQLYVSTGIGETPEVSQDLAHPGGKILRLDPRVAAPVAAVVALGLRNPWRFSVDRGRLLIGDVGGELSEEINVLPATPAAAANFGFPRFEGRTPLEPGASPAGLRAPALVRRHADGWCSIVGGYVVRDRTLPELDGRYLYGDVCSGRVRSARIAGLRLVDDRPLPVRIPYLVSFGRDAAGRVYATSLGGGVFRFVRAPVRRTSP